MAIRGRFAPTPSGPLHFGSLVAALASYLNAKSQGGEWLVRIEDVDELRTRPGASDDILRCLDSLGLHWDGEVVFQSQRKQLYQDVCQDLLSRAKAYWCGCSRRKIGQGLGLGIDGAPIYPGFCRTQPPAERVQLGIRLLSTSAGQRFTDAIQGDVEQNVEETVGDFIIYRADGYASYHLAVVVDDQLQRVTEVVRGSDLLDSTARQLLLHSVLGWQAPRYAHIPVALHDSGEKLSKQTRAPAIQATAAEVVRGLRFLGQLVPADVADASAAEILNWATRHWNLGAVPRCRGVKAFTTA